MVSTAVVSSEDWPEKARKRGRLQRCRSACSSEVQSGTRQKANETIEHLIELARQRRLSVALLGVPGGLAQRGLPERLNAYAHLLQDGHDYALVLVQKGEKKMEIVNQRVAGLPSACDGVVQRLAGLYGEFVLADHTCTMCNRGASIVCRNGRPTRSG